MRRLLKIAWREYLAYVRTRGFWFSLLMLPVGISMIVVAPMVTARSTPTPTVAIVDLTSRSLTGPVALALATRADGAKPVGLVVAAPGAPYRDRAEATAPCALISPARERCPAAASWTSRRSSGRPATRFRWTTGAGISPAAPCRAPSAKRSSRLCEPNVWRPAVLTRPR